MLQLQDGNLTEERVAKEATMAPKYTALSAFLPSLQTGHVHPKQRHSK